MAVHGHGDAEEVLDVFATAEEAIAHAQKVGANVIKATEMEYDPQNDTRVAKA